MKPKRLFLFAGYNASGILDDALLYYLQSLSVHGDIVLIMDSNCSASELKKAQKYCVYTSAQRHGEYDFGSYKRAYIWATENLNLSDYEYVYMVNDSVYGPLYDIKPYIEKMEQFDSDAFGLVKNPNPDHPHIQSWFVGLRPNIFMTAWYDTFIRSVKKLSSKGAITHMYEHGLSKLITQNGLTWKCLYTVKNRGIYNRIKHLYKIRMPFMKKVAFNRHYGALGRQILYVLNKLSPDLRDAILTSAYAQYGEQNVKQMLTRNPFRTGFRHIRYAIHKIITKGL